MLRSKLPQWVDSGLSRYFVTFSPRQDFMLVQTAEIGQKRTYVENGLMSELSNKRVAMTLSLSIAANGHVTLDFGDYDSVAYRQVCAKLEKELGFSRQGRTVAGLDEGISHSFLRVGLEISAGWDNWSGSYLLSNSDASDAVLRRLHAELT